VSPPTRRSVAVAGHLGDPSAARAGLHSADPGVRAAALGALARLGVATDAEIAGSLADPDPLVRRRAVTLAAHHPAVDLQVALNDVDPSVVEVAAWACGERHGVADATLDRLIELATTASVDPLVRESSVAALGALGDARGLDAILAATGDRPAIRRRAVLALAPFLDGEHPRADEIDAVLRRTLADRDWQVRQAAEDVLPGE
jgi:HEAT repeat protein